MTDPLSVGTFKKALCSTWYLSELFKGSMGSIIYKSSCTSPLDSQFKYSIGGGDEMVNKVPSGYGGLV